MRSGVAVSLMLALILPACSEAGSDTSGAGGAGGAGSGGESAGDGGSTAGDGGAASSPSAGPSGPGSTTAGSTTTGSGSSGSSSSTVAASTSTTGGGEDEYAEEREICVAKINELRATEGLPAYGRWGDGEECADGQATSDEQTMTPHGSFPGCGASAQNECLGHGPSGVAACLEQMWAEKDLEACSGCILCHDTQGECPDCVFQTCGHYVNMSAKYFSEVACGFSSLGGWDVQNFR
jgi:hypothetical protein